MLLSRTTFYYTRVGLVRILFLNPSQHFCSLMWSMDPDHKIMQLAYRAGLGPFVKVIRSKICKRIAIIDEEHSSSDAVKYVPGTPYPLAHQVSPFQRTAQLLDGSVIICRIIVRLWRCGLIHRSVHSLVLLLVPASKRKVRKGEEGKGKSILGTVSETCVRSPARVYSIKGSLHISYLKLRRKERSRARASRSAWSSWLSRN